MLCLNPACSKIAGIDWNELLWCSEDVMHRILLSSSIRRTWLADHTKKPTELSWAQRIQNRTVSIHMGRIPSTCVAQVMLMQMSTTFRSFLLAESTLLALEKHHFLCLDERCRECWITQCRPRFAMVAQDDRSSSKSLLCRLLALGDISREVSLKPKPCSVCHSLSLASGRGSFRDGSGVSASLTSLVEGRY